MGVWNPRVMETQRRRNPWKKKILKRRHLTWTLLPWGVRRGRCSIGSESHEFICDLWRTLLPMWRHLQVRQSVNEQKIGKKILEKPATVSVSPFRCQFFSFTTKSGDTLSPQWSFPDLDSWTRRHPGRLSSRRYPPLRSELHSTYSHILKFANFGNCEGSKLHLLGNPPRNAVANTCTPRGNQHEVMKLHFFMIWQELIESDQMLWCETNLITTHHW